MSATMHLCADYLLNAVWQTVLLCAAAWAAARMVRPLGPAAEHGAWVASLCAQCVLPACAAPWLAEELRRWLDSGHGHAGTVTVTMGAVQPLGHGGTAAALVPLAIAAWAVVTAGLGIRLLLQVRRLSGLRSDASPLTLDEESSAWLQASCARIGMAQVELLSSATVETPVTFGLWRPVLLLPHGFAERVGAPQLRAALAHELAHVARHDAAKQMLYRVLTLPLAWHPAVRFALAQIAETRERVCDGTAAAMTGGSRQYARSLLELASLLTARRPAHTHAIGLFDANQLERRVLMLNRRVFPVGRSLRLALMAGSGVLAMAACTSAVALHLEAPSQPLNPGSGQATAHGPVRIPSGVEAGQNLSRVMPVYPADAKHAKIQGAVVLHAIIGKTGAVEQLQVVSGPEELQASALEAVRQWVYKPYLLNGEPTEVDTTVTVNYSMGESGPAPTAESPHDSSQTSMPRIIRQVDAQYPAAARQAKVSGNVMVAVQVGADGTVSDVTATSGPEELRQSAVDAVRQYRFAPAMRNGEAVPMNMQVSVNFQMF